MGAGTEDWIRHDGPAKLACFLLYPPAPVVASDQGRRAGNWNRGQPCARRGCRGPVVGGLPALFCARRIPEQEKSPAFAGLLREAPTPDGAGTGGIQISPPDVDIEPSIAAYVRKRRNRSTRVPNRVNGRGWATDGRARASLFELASAVVLPRHGAGRRRRTLHPGRRRRAFGPRLRKCPLHAARLGRPRHRRRRHHARRTVTAISHLGLAWRWGDLPRPARDHRLRATFTPATGRITPRRRTIAVASRRRGAGGWIVVARPRRAGWIVRVVRSVVTVVGIVVIAAITVGTAIPIAAIDAAAVVAAVRVGILRARPPVVIAARRGVADIVVCRTTSQGEAGECDGQKR